MAGAAQLTALMKMLADPTRRAAFERIAREGEVEATGLVKGTKVSQPAVSQHLRALGDAGLVTECRDGRHIHYGVAPKGLTPLIDWLGHHQTFWNERFANLERLPRPRRTLYASWSIRVPCPGGRGARAVGCGTRVPSAAAPF